MRSYTVLAFTSPSVFTLFVFFVFHGLVRAKNVIITTSDTTQAKVGWESGPKTRGTLMLA
jgi:hypothetical protein